ncbi:MAG: phosphatase PAP2 family protein [Vicinamibacterales bacterium]
MPPPRWGIARRLFAIDILVMGFVIAFGGGAAARWAHIPDWPEVLLTCIAIVVVVPLLGWLRTRTGATSRCVLHDWSFALSVYVIGRAVVLVAGPGHSGRVFDGWLIDADRWLTGGDPTVWLTQVAHPILTDVLQIAYEMFWLLPLAVALELYASGREWRFRQWAFVCGCGFFAAFAGYLVLPAVGPRHILHTLDAAGTLRLAPRDAFPSVQTLVTLLAFAWAWRYRLGVRWVVTVAGALPVVAVLYLRGQYLTSVLAGGALAILCLVLAPLLHGWLAGHLGTLDADRTS